MKNVKKKKFLVILPFKIIAVVVFFSKLDFICDHVSIVTQRFQLLTI
jgi:hypothetical protein